MISDTSNLAGLKVSIKATHTYVGDLQFSLTRGAGRMIGRTLLPTVATREV